MASNQKTNPSLSVARPVMPKIWRTPLFETIDCQQIYSYFKKHSPTSTSLITELISKNANYKTARESILKLYKKKDIKQAVDHVVGKFDLESVPENSHPKNKSGYIKLLEKHLDIALHPKVKEESSSVLPTTKISVHKEKSNSEENIINPDTEMMFGWVELNPFSYYAITQLLNSSPNWREITLLVMIKSKMTVVGVGNTINAKDLKALLKSSEKENDVWWKIFNNKISLITWLNTHAHGWTLKGCDEDLSNCLESSGSFDNESKESESSDGSFEDANDEKLCRLGIPTTIYVIKSPDKKRSNHYSNKFKFNTIATTVANTSVTHSKQPPHKKKRTEKDVLEEEFDPNDSDESTDLDEILKIPLKPNAMHEAMKKMLSNGNW